MPRRVFHRKLGLVAALIFTAQLFAASFCAAQPQSAKAGPAEQAPGQAIRAVLAVQTDAWNRGDIPAFMAGYWKSPYTEFVSATGIFQGWQDVLDRYKRSYPNRAAMGHLTFSGLEVHVLCPDSAYVVGHYSLARTKGHPHGVFTLIFRKFPDGWKIVNDHTTAWAETPAHQHK